MYVLRRERKRETREEGMHGRGRGEMGGGQREREEGEEESPLTGTRPAL